MKQSFPVKKNELEESVNLEQIFHPAGLGDLYKTVDHFVNAVKEVGKPLKLCFNGTTVVAKPGQTAQEVIAHWNSDRADYQKTFDKQHPALCHLCQSRTP